ncbi:hypothetical protein 2209_scaffold64_00003 [Bacteriophage sp.]|nr:hypothetical protein 2209_scaffold64_00003 [Bacteriophage sp.]
MRPSAPAPCRLPSAHNRPRSFRRRRCLRPAALFVPLRPCFPSPFSSFRAVPSAGCTHLLPARQPPSFPDRRQSPLRQSS